jgi:hypothetical protein
VAVALATSSVFTTSSGSGPFSRSMRLLFNCGKLDAPVVTPSGLPSFVSEVDDAHSSAGQSPTASNCASLPLARSA